MQTSFRISQESESIMSESRLPSRHHKKAMQTEPFQKQAPESDAQSPHEELNKRSRQMDQPRRRSSQQDQESLFQLTKVVSCLSLEKCFLLLVVLSILTPFENLSSVNCDRSAQDSCRDCSCTCLMVSRDRGQLCGSIP